MSNARLYTEQEISAILKRSGELQAGKGRQETQGLTFAELEKIADEVGIDRDVLQAAVADLDRGASQNRPGWPGFPVTFSVERVIAGEISEDQWPDAVEAIAGAMGVVGSSGQVGKMLEWTFSGRRVQFHVSITPANGQTKVRIHGTYTRFALALFLPILLFTLSMAFLIPMSAGFTPLASGALSITLGAILFFLLRFGFTSHLKRKSRKADRLIQKLEAIINTPSAATREQPPLTTESEKPPLSTPSSAPAGKRTRT